MAGLSGSFIVCDEESWLGCVTLDEDEDDEDADEVDESKRLFCGLNDDSGNTSNDVDDDDDGTAAAADEDGFFMPKYD